MGQAEHPRTPNSKGRRQTREEKEKIERPGQKDDDPELPTAAQHTECL